MSALLRFVPVYQPRVWGGRQLQTHFDRKLPAGDMGESWELVDRSEAQSVVADGPYKGLSLRELCEKHGKELLKHDWAPQDRFPLIVKWLDCREELSLQVHPRKETARELGGEPKTEAWWVAATQPGAYVYAGFDKPMSEEAFVVALEKETVAEYLQQLPTQAGDFLFVPAGRLHGIGPGNLILEVQQNSDTTYRVYDWGRPRELHLAQALKSIRWSDIDAALTRPTPATQQILTQNEYFTIERHTVAAGAVFELPAAPSAQILSVVEGQLDPYQAGENLLLPWGQTLKISASKNTLLLLTHSFL